MSETAAGRKPQLLIRDLMCIADTKWVLGHWLIKVLPNARRLDDFTALSALLQEELGHTRALFSYIEEMADLKEQTLELDRLPHEINSMALLDSPPISWPDFLARASCADLATWVLLQSPVHSAALPSGLLAKISNEEHYHQLYYTGCLESLSEHEKRAAAQHIEDSVLHVLAWLGPAGSDSLQHTHAGQRLINAVNQQAHTAGIRLKGEWTPTGAQVVTEGWEWDRRRPRGSAVPAALYHLMVPVDEMARLARRPRSEANADAFSTVE